MIPFQHGVFATAAGAASGFEAIATVTASGGETSLTFSSIPSTYASLQIRGIARDTDSGNTNTSLLITMNNTVINSSMHYLAGNGTTASAGGLYDQGNINVPRSCWTSGTSAYIYGVLICDIHDYADTTRYKTLRIFSGADGNTGTSASGLSLTSGSWQSTLAINSVKISVQNISFAAGTTFALYGIKGAA